jgi:hypothetical protein
MVDAKMEIRVKEKPGMLISSHSTIRSIAVWVVLIAAGTIGCGSPQSKFVGKWVSPQGNLEFFSDGTYLLNHNNGAIPWEGKFVAFDDGRIKLTGVFLMGTLKAGTLILEERDHTQWVFQRAR